nr:MAG TPA: hypothetical protein [Caudoviricetes sp.]
MLDEMFVISWVPFFDMLDALWSDDHFVRSDLTCDATVFFYIDMAYRLHVKTSLYQQSRV